MSITVDQLKKIKLTAPTSRCGTSSGCPTVYSIYDVLQSFFSTNSYTLYTDATLTGNGTATSKLKIASQGASSGQVLTYNGTTWLPANPTTGEQTLTLEGDEITLSGGGAIPAGDLISSDVSNALEVGTDGLLFVTPSATSLPIATVAGQIVYWTGLTYATALEYNNYQTPTAGTTDISLPHVPISSLPVRVFLNGVLKRNLIDYTISGNMITFNYVFATNDKVITIYYN